jgi:hypothetical protein
MSARGEGFFADEAARQNSDLAAEGGVACVKNFYLCATVDQEKFFGSNQKSNPEIIVGRFAIAHFSQKFLSDGEQRVVAACFCADRRSLPDPFRARSGSCPLLVVKRRRRSGRWLNPFHGGDEAVAAARKGLNEARLLVRITKGAAERLNRRVHAVLEIDEGVGRPEPVLQFFAREQFARLFKEQGENLERPASETDFPAVLAQLAGAKVNVVGVEAKPTFGRKLIVHGRSREHGVYFGRRRNSTGERQASLSTAGSACYRFTSVLPTKDPRCIERFAVWDETARAMRNEMKSSNTKILGKEETKMKITTVAKTSMIAAVLGFACLLPATAHAQSDAMPDSFAFSAEETIVAQPVQVASNQAKADFEGKVSLPYDVNCGGKNLKAGQYLLSVKSEGTGRVVTLHGGVQNVNMHMREVAANRDTNHSALLVRKSGYGRRLEAVYVEGLNVTLYLDTNSNGNNAAMERLPIS